MKKDVSSTGILFLSPKLLFGWKLNGFSFEEISGFAKNLLLQMGVSENRGYPQIIHFNRVFPL